MAKKRNAQDATRKYDIAPLRKRIAELEKTVKMLVKRTEVYERDVITVRSQRS